MAEGDMETRGGIRKGRTVSDRVVVRGADFQNRLSETRLIHVSYEHERFYSSSAFAENAKRAKFASLR